MLEGIQDSEDFVNLSTECNCPERKSASKIDDVHVLTLLDFQVCSPTEVQPISIGDKVSSLCTLHTSASHFDNLMVSYYTDEGIETTVPSNDICHLASSILNFDLLVSRPNNVNREAKIYIFNVTGEASLNVLCTATQINDLNLVAVSSNALMIEFILSSEL